MSDPATPARTDVASSSKPTTSALRRAETAPSISTSAKGKSKSTNGKARGGSVRALGKRKSMSGATVAAISAPVVRKQPSDVPRVEVIEISDDEDMTVAAASSPPRPSTSSFPTFSSSSTLYGASRSSFVEPPYNIHSLSPYAWVLVSSDGKLFGDGSREEYIWWPAMATRNSDDTFDVCPCGILPGVAVGAEPTIKVDSPSRENLLPLTLSGRLRFETPKFEHPPAQRKRQKRDHEELTAQWTNAVKTIVQKKDEEMPDVQWLMSTSKFRSDEDEINEDGEDELMSELAPQPLPTAASEAEEELWEPPGPDPFIRFPEPVFARWHAATNVDYWPALVVQYVSPNNKKAKAGKYHIHYLDGKKKTIPREWFYLLSEPGFTKCRLGPFRTMTVPHAADESKFWEEKPFAALPQPGAYTYLSMREQFRFVTPVVDAILRNEYKPAQAAFAQFMEGGKARKMLIESSSSRGKINEEDVEDLMHWIHEYCLREENQAVVIQDESMPNTTVPDNPLDSTDNTVVPEVETVSTASSPPPTVLAQTPASPGPDSHPDAPTIITPDLSTIISAEAFSDAPETATRMVFDKFEVPAFEASTEAPSDVAALDIADDTPAVSALPTPDASATSILDIIAAPSSDGPIMEAPVDSAIVSTPDEHTLDTSVACSAVDSLPTPTKEPIPSNRGLRPLGCEAYEALDSRTKMDFCSNVILKQALKQVLLWRADSRRSAELLSDEKEEQLSEEAEKLLKDTDWVADLLNVRETLATTGNSDLKQLKRTIVGGTKRRPQYSA
ncbi:hypothetical protein CYLTODRAFT_441539 [Cylindrobasidium torrendii FP15055 ss-10]|uniref:PWWP domain-containing protein n=1 Tax=Cylindrobasidium torrendii FP15055 ss-10 TaxID=1314674 RepID=A0A0D7BN80_9AGAR|nr:hypothetical protein CYLTODRAFT_441539 [Cylindrobasidium torrendii FP15055 ss-10]